MAAATAQQAPAPEPLLDENPDRYCMFPVKHDNVWNEYKKAEVRRAPAAATARNLDLGGGNVRLATLHRPALLKRSQLSCGMLPTCCRSRFGRVR